MKQNKIQNNNSNLGLLIDFYGELLSKRQKEALVLNVENDSSLSEIAEILEISRQAAADAVKKGKIALENYEKKLGNLERYLKNKSEIQRCIELASTGNNSKKLVDALKKIEKEL